MPSFCIKNKYVVLPLSLIWLTNACSPAPTQPDTQIRETSSSPEQGWIINPDTDLNTFFECLEANNQTLISAHRAGSYPGYPENSLESAIYVSERIPAIHEIDVATSRDGILFLMHDDDLDRTTTGEGLVTKSDWNVIASTKLVDDNGKTTGFSPPKLSTFLQWAKDKTLVQIDFKRSTRYEDVIQTVKDENVEDQVIYIAYSMAQAQRLHSLAPSAMISLSIQSMSDLNRAVASGIPMDRLIAFTGTEDPRPRVFSLLNDRDVEVIFGTLGRRDSFDQEAERSGSNQIYKDLSGNGVDIIATDRPLEAHQALMESDRFINGGVCGISKKHD